MAPSWPYSVLLSGDDDPGILMRILVRSKTRIILDPDLTRGLARSSEIRRQHKRSLIWL